MVKSSLKVKRVSTNKTASNHKKKTLKEIIENKIHKYSKQTHQPFISRIRLFEELHEIHKNKTTNQIKFYLKNTLVKLLDERILIKHRDSYRFSKVYLNKQAKKLKKLKEKQKQKNKLQNKNKNKLNKDKNTSPQAVSIFANNAKTISKAISKIKSKIIQKFSKTANNKASIIIKSDSNVNTFGSGNLLISTTTQQKNKASKKEYKRIHPAVWQYHDTHKSISNPSPDGWYNYDLEASDIVEDAWQKYVINRGLNDVRSVHSGEWEYMVDFMNWNQTNIIHTAHTRRNIRRIDEKGNITKNPYQ